MTKDFAKDSPTAPRKCPEFLPRPVASISNWVPPSWSTWVTHLTKSHHLLHLQPRRQDFLDLPPSALRPLRPLETTDLTRPLHPPQSLTFPNCLPSHSTCAPQSRPILQTLGGLGNPIFTQLNPMILHNSYFFKY